MNLAWTKKTETAINDGFKGLIVLKSFETYNT